MHPDEAVGAELACRRSGGRSARRAAGEPLAHVAGPGRASGTSCLRSDRRALIPRPETEGLVDLLLARVRSGIGRRRRHRERRARAEPGERGRLHEVVGVGRVALPRSRWRGENRAATGVRVSLLRGDLCAPLRPDGFDALVSNPPYLTAAEYAALDPAVRDWEPASALVGGIGGAEIDHPPAGRGARRCSGRAAGSRWSWIALAPRQCARRASALGWNDVTIQADLFGRERYLLARRSDAT